MIQIKAGENLCVTVPVKNIGTIQGTFTCRGRIFNKSNVEVGNFMAHGTSTPQSQRIIAAGATWNFQMQKTFWANGDPLGFGHLEKLDVRWQVECTETGLVVEVWDLSIIEHFAGMPTAQILTRTYSIC